MHYGRKDFSKNGQATIKVINGPQNLISRGHRKGMSTIDFAQLNALYQCDHGKCSISFCLDVSASFMNIWWHFIGTNYGTKQLARNKILVSQNFITNPDFRQFFFNFYLTIFLKNCRRIVAHKFLLLVKLSSISSDKFCPLR